MWGNNNTNNNNYNYPHQGPGQPTPTNNNMNNSKIPMNPGIALLGLVGKNTINDNKQNWQDNGNQGGNINYAIQQNQRNPWANVNNWGGNNSNNSFNNIPNNYNNNNNMWGRSNTMPSMNNNNNNFNNNNFNNNNNGYQNMNWNNYQLQAYMLNKAILDQYIPTIFQRWDMDRSGTIEMHEFPGMICELFRCLNMSPPSQNDIWYLMWRFDQDQNGKIDYYEWADMVYTIGGLKKA